MARRLRVPAKWLREEADAGRVPCLKVVNAYLFNPAAVLEALAVKAAKTRQGGGDGR
jgi:hypothetical protein